MSALKLLAAVSAAALLTACASGPDYKAPAAPAATGAFVSAPVAPVAAAEPPADWWRLYDDPAVDRLVAEAQANNRDVARATANLAQVRAALSESRAAQLPSTALSLSATRSRQPNPATGRPAEASTVSAGLDVAYELDFFGRVRRAIEAARADTGAAQAALDVVRVSTAAETARAYADACAAGAQLDVAQRTLTLLEETARLTRTQMEAGGGAELDVARAEAQAETAHAALPPLRAQREAALFRLSVLVGRPPAAVSPEAAACVRIPQVNTAIPVGDGASLLKRRPDVRQAERRLAAATARIGVATASLYPSVTLGGSLLGVGGGGQRFGDEIQFSTGPLISWSFPNLLAAKARVAQADAAAQGELAAFEQTTLTALQEVETALSAYGRELQRRGSLRKARDRSADAARLARLREQQGADSFLTVLDAERTLAALEAQLAQSEAAVASDQITLFKALGGGWQGEGSKPAT